MRREAYLIEKSGIIAFQCAEIGDFLVDEFIDWFENRNNREDDGCFRSSLVIAGIFEGDAGASNSLCGYFYTRDGRRYKVENGIAQGFPSCSHS